MSPPDVSWFPSASRSVNVTVDVPPDAMLDGANVTVDCDKLTAPGVTVMLAAADVSGALLMLAVIELLPAVVPVKVAV